MPKFIVRDDRHGANLRTVQNGKIRLFEVGAELEDEQDVIDHLLDLGIAVEVLSGKSKGAGSSSEEGSVEVEPAPAPKAVAKKTKKK